MESYLDDRDADVITAYGGCLVQYNQSIKRPVKKANKTFLLVFILIILGIYNVKIVFLFDAIFTQLS